MMRAQPTPLPQPCALLIYGQMSHAKVALMSKSLFSALISGAQDLAKNGGLQNLAAQVTGSGGQTGGQNASAPPAAGGGLSGMAASAKGLWDGQSALTKGAVAGGLVGLLMNENARKMAGTGLQVGGAAVVGALAFRAYSDWKAGKSASATPADAPMAALPAPSDAFLPPSAAAQEDLALRLVQAMVAATKADGHVTSAERARIMGQLPNLGLGDDAAALIAAEIDAPFDVGRIAALAHTEEERVEIYAASLLVIDPEAPAEKGYLAMLAARLNLDPGLVAHLHARTAALA
jgi:uncharacterized membrane protein YebE (DUF533 family)